MVLRGLPYTVTDADMAAGQVSACFEVPALGLSTHLHYEFKSLGHTEVPWACMHDSN